MKDQLIKLHDEFVDKGMKKSSWVHLEIDDKVDEFIQNIPNDYVCYVLLDMQTWLRKKHGIYVIVGVVPYPLSKVLFYFYIKYGENLGSFKRSNYSLMHDTYEKSLEKGLQEGIKLVE